MDESDYYKGGPRNDPSMSSSIREAAERQANLNNRGDINKARQVGGVQHQLGALNKQIGRMEEALGHLHSRLEPVMATSGPGSDRAGEADRAPSSPLECEIASARNRIEQLTGAILLINSRIEL